MPKGYFFALIFSFVTLFVLLREANLVKLKETLQHSTELSFFLSFGMIVVSLIVLWKVVIVFIFNDTLSIMYFKVLIIVNFW